MFEGPPEHLKEIGPKCFRMESGDDAWILYPGASPRPISTSAQAGRKYEDYLRPTNFDNMRPVRSCPGRASKTWTSTASTLTSSSRHHARDGYHPSGRAHALRPDVQRLAGQFCSYDRARLIGLAAAALDDREAVVDEMRRVRTPGCAAEPLSKPERHQPQPPRRRADLGGGEPTCRSICTSAPRRWAACTPRLSWRSCPAHRSVSTVTATIGGDIAAMILAVSSTASC
jgi:hypothetical protein